MATYTENYDLTLTEPEDVFDIQDFNGNFEAIDTMMAENETVLHDVNEKIGIPDAGETIFSLLKNNSISLIKSIQTVTASHSTSNEKQSTLNIETVDPAKCIVLMDRMQDTTAGSLSISYSLAETALSVTTGSSSSNGNIKIRFQIIEFN